MLLSEMIQEDLVKVDLEATNKIAAIDELVDLMISAQEIRLTDRSEVIEAVLTRERSLSTGLEHGFAVPHGTVTCVGDVVAALGISPKGLDFESQDGKPAQLVVLLIIPKGHFQGHVRTLAGIAKLAMNHEFRDRIFAARTVSEVMGTVYELETQSN